MNSESCDTEVIMLKLLINYILQYINKKLIKIAIYYKFAVFIAFLIKA